MLRKGNNIQQIFGEGQQCKNKILQDVYFIKK